MAVLNLTAARLLELFKGLLPRGRVWPREVGSDMERALAGLVPTYERLAARDANLLTDAFPATAFELLPEWEFSLGLPDPCAGEAPTLQQRRAQVVARLTARGGQSVPYMIERAARLGYEVTVREYAPARLGVMRFGDRMQGPEWAHVWAIRAPATTITPFRFGLSSFGERFRTWGNDVLECELRAVTPAHTILLFQYI
ncbi:MAG TPA: putative phage tail protein [Roseomonas sp.]|nr:putative phage tail protein [Roseomonas sp.]